MASASVHRNLDRYAAVLGLLIAVALFPVQLIFTHVYARTIPIVLATACGLYIVASHIDTDRTPVTLSRGVTHALPGAVAFGTAGLVLLAHGQGARTRLFYGMAGLLGTFVLGQVLFARDGDLHPSVVLVQIVGLAAAVRFAAFDTTAGLVGIDVWLHVPHFTRAILADHSLQAMGTTKYVMAPFYHLVVAVGTWFAGVPPRVALLLTIGLVMPLIPVLVYLTADLLMARRWALFAAAMFAFSDAVIRWGIHLIPTSLGLVFFLSSLYLIVRATQLRTGLGETVLLVLGFVAIALTHQVSSFIMLVFLGSGWLTQQIIRTGLFDEPASTDRLLDTGDLQAISFSGYFVFNIGLLTLIWSLTPYHGQSFIETVLIFVTDSLFSRSTLSGGLASTGGGAAEPLTWLITHLDVLGFLFFVFGATVGSLFAFRRGRRNQAVLTLVTAGVTMTAFTLLPPLVGVGTFLPGRWYAFLYAIMAIMTAAGLEYLRSDLSPVLLVVVLLVFLYAFPTVMVASPVATLDSRVIATETPRLSYTEEELAAVRTIGATTAGGSGDLVGTDFPYVMVFNRVTGGNDVGRYRFATADIPDGGTAREDTVIYRRYQTTGAPRFDDGDGDARTYRIRPVVMCNENRDTVYSNGEVRMCRTTPG